ncbi:MAG: gliding motility-associated protein GldE [Bacteroidia bacterium]|nr:gliding motility-associated protein GldE [Bacteroidia bacterium]
MDSEPDPYSSFIPILIFAATGYEIGLGFFAIILLLICSALISGSEVAFFSLNANDINDLEQENTLNASRILSLKEDPNRLLATILISNNFINIALIIISYLVFAKLIPQAVTVTWSDGIYAAISVRISPVLIEGLINTIGITFLLVLFGEVIPKVYASRNYMRMVHVTSLPLALLNTVLFPLSSMLMASTSFIEERVLKRGAGTSKSDLDKAIELTVGSDQVNNREINILKGILKFQDVSVTQIMKSRMDIVAIDKEFTFDALLPIFKESGYSRFPVYEDDLDKIIGILYAKDFIGLHDNGKKYDWTGHVKDNVIFVPESKNIYDLLKDFQMKHIHMAVIVDEFGGSSGLVTLEDIMEEVIGEIQDEFDVEEEITYTKLDDYNYIFEGKALLNDVSRIIGLPTTTFDEYSGESDSLAGLILEVLGYIPRNNQIISAGPFRFKIMSANFRRIEEVRVTLPRTN